MNSEIEAEVHAMRDIALVGQITVIYAKPNVGKTLITQACFIESIEAGIIDPKDFYYINADDNKKEAIVKGQIAHKYGYEMFVPGLYGFEIKSFEEILRHLIKEDEADGKIFVLDTLKKFVDLMKKGQQRDFMALARKFTVAGGTLVLLAHANKNLNSENKIVHCGTSDIPEDVDCVYLMNVINTDANTRTVEFFNDKARGNVKKLISFSYSLDMEMPYAEKLKSVVRLDDKQANQAVKAGEEAKRLEADQPIIDAISRVLKEAPVAKIELIKLVYQNTAFSRVNVTKVLTRYTGDDTFPKKWKIDADYEVGKEKAITYSLTNS